MVACVLSKAFHPITTLYAGQVAMGGKTKEELCLMTEYIQLDGDELNHAEKVLGKRFPTYARVYTVVGDDARQLFLNW